MQAKKAANKPRMPRKQPEQAKAVKRFQVICPGCKGAYLETNERYDPDVPLRGYMLQMAPKFGPQGFNWTRPGSDHDLGPAIECPGCGAPIVWGSKEKPIFEEIKNGK